MPKGYWIARVEVTDTEKYKAYIDANAKAFKLFGAGFLVCSGRLENPEGTSRSRNIVIEVPLVSGGARLLEVPRIPGSS